MKMKMVYLSIQSTDAGVVRPSSEDVAKENGWDLDFFGVNSSDVDQDPLLYNELVRKTKAADFVLIRVMADPYRMLRFEQYEKVVNEIGGSVFVYSGDPEVAALYRGLFRQSDEDYKLLYRYCRAKGRDNDRAIVMWLRRMLTGEGDVPQPDIPRTSGIYHPDFGADITMDEYLGHLDPSEPTVGVVFPVGNWLYGNMAHIDAFIREIEAQGMNVIPNYQTFEQANIDVIRIEAANGLTSLNGIVTLGFLFDCVEKANEEMEFFDGILKDIAKKLATNPEDKKVSGLFVTMTNYCEGVSTRSEYTGTMEIAGATAVADDNVWEGKARKQFFIGDEWLLKEQFQADFIVHSRGLGLGEVDKQAQWDTYSVYFKEMNAYKNGNYFLLNSTLSPVLRIAFMATQFYPDVFGEDYAVNLVQEYYDKFITNVKDFDAKTDATWVITADMVKT